MLLFQQAGEKLIHVVKHILKGLIQFFRIYKSRIQKADAGSGVMF